ncbi:hypothetical protein CAMRE0001_2835 [Campylobacter rectus RM3267]|uniref:Uncharacterized protein n=1 Tax=Campylobacter rectus RM3267 TaxID=553218 RepID=B9D125_CAMRE|nr:hypothetical protein CAMRE0001_2835 [Campylobacter rectus RM3267]
MTLSATAGKSRRTRRILTIYKGFWRTKTRLMNFWGRILGARRRF